MPIPRNLLNLKTVAKGYGSRSVLREVTLGVLAGERIGIVGENGGGKSTLLRLIAGVEQPGGEFVLAWRPASGQVEGDDGQDGKSPDAVESANAAQPRVPPGCVSVRVHAASGPTVPGGVPPPT